MKTLNLIDLEEELIQYIQDILGDSILEGDQDEYYHTIDESVIEITVNRIKEETGSYFINYNIKKYATECVEDYNASFQGI